MMKWDVKHDLAKQVIDGYLEKAKTEMQENEVVAGLSDEDKAIVSEELASMIESIRKRYKLYERMQEQPKAETEVEMAAEVQTEEKAEAPVEEPQTEDAPKPKRGRKKAESTGEKKERKPRTKKAKEEVA